jgi:low affinity Fe/Cu permease
MKFNFKLKDIQIADIKIGEVAVETEFSINEMVAIRKESEIVLEKMPRYLQQLATTYKTFAELDNKIDEFEKEYSRG